MTAPSHAALPASSQPTVPEGGSRGRRCRDAHALTRSSRGPRAARNPGWAQRRRCRFVQRRACPRTARSPGWAGGLRCLAEHAAQCRSCGVANGIVHQVGPSGTAHGSSELVKARTPRRGRPSCRNTPPGAWRNLSSPISWILLLRVGGSMIQPTWESGKVLQPEASGPRRRSTGFLVPLQA